MRIALGVGLQRFLGDLNIEPGAVHFDGPLELGPPFAITRIFFAALGTRWALTLGHDPRTGDPIVMQGRRGELQAVAELLRGAGFPVESRRRRF